MFYDKVHRKRITTLPSETILLGRYLIKPSDEILLNDLPVYEQRYIVPDETQHYSLNSIKGKITSEILEFPQIGNNLLDILTKTQGANSFEEVCAILPLNQKNDERIELNDFENYLMEHLFHLESICRDPKSKLTINSEKLPISRAKKIPYKAISNLAAHSEDWSHRRLRTVVPKRILTNVRDETLNIYENKLTAVLLTQLAVYLNNRIDEELKRVINYFEVIDKILCKEFNGEDTWYGKTRRNYELIGDAYEDILDFKEKAEKTKEELERIRRRVLALFSSRLYQNCSKYSISNAQLIQTNLLQGDQHYRYVWALYQELNKQKISYTSKKEAQRNYQKTTTAFSEYCWLLISRALNEMAYLSTDFERDSNSFSFSKNGFSDINIKKEDDDSFTIDVGGQTIAWVPVADDWLKQEAKEQKLPNNTIVLFYKDMPFMNKEKWSSKDYDWLTILPRENNSCLIPVSCDNLDSVERVMRILQYYTLKEHFAKYPFRIKNAFLTNDAFTSKHASAFVRELEFDASTKEIRLIRTLDAAKLSSLSKKIKIYCKNKRNYKADEFISYIKKTNESLNKWLRAFTFKDPAISSQGEVTFEHQNIELCLGTRKYGANLIPFIEVNKLQEIISISYAKKDVIPNPIFLDNILGADFISIPYLDKGKLKYKNNY